MIIFAGIVAGMPHAVGATAQLVSEGTLNPFVVILVVLLVAGVTGFVVFVERAQRRIPIHHARRQQGRKLFAAQTQHLPLKLNMSGVIPPIFASSLILFPASIVRFFGGETNAGFMQQVANALSPGQALYTLLYGALIIFFCFFYTALVFDSRETAENLKKSGAFVPGVRPGAMTAKYIDQVLTRLTVAGAIYITLVCLTPEFLITYFNVPFTFGGTSLLITVVVVMDFMAQLQAHLMSHQYEGLLKKANLKSLRGSSGRGDVARQN
jgi:preprotein translocase subunit SecY